MKKKGMYRYDLADGSKRIALSPVCLDYATDDNGVLDLASVRGGDAGKINLIADPELGVLLGLTYQEAWETPEKVLSMKKEARIGLSYYQNCAVMSKGRVYVRNGRFMPLSQFLESATKADLIIMLTDIAVQSALAQLELAKKEIKEDDSE